MSQSTKSHSFSRLRQIDDKLKPPARPKSRIKYPTIKDIIFHRRHLPRTQYYFTSGHENLGKPRNVHDEQMPFVVPPKSLLFAYHQWMKSRNQQALKNRKNDKKSAHRQLEEKSKDTLRRLRVDVKAEKDEAEKHKDLDKATAMTDIDPDYFTEIIGHVNVGGRFSKQCYIEDAREVLRTKLLIGEERDACIRIDQQFDEEKRRLEETKERNRICVNAFEEFLSKDHEESMAVLEKTEEEVKSTYAMTTKRNELSKDLGQVRLDIYSLEESWRTVKMCQKFLYQISPIAWRQEHDWIHRSPSGASIISGKLEDLLGRSKIVDNMASLESLIEMFEVDIANARPTELYFKDPRELTRVFRSMELQNLNALIHLESLAGPRAEMTTSITETKSLINREIGDIKEALADLEANIRSNEERARSLEEYVIKLLHGVFRDLVCSEPVLYLLVFVEDAYESCIGRNDANLDTYSMMCLIETTYERLNMELDNLPHDIVRVCEKEGFRQEEKRMRDAEDAARKFELMHRLLAALERIMEAPKPKQNKRQPAVRTLPGKSRAKVVHAASSPLGEDEMTFLNFFTNYCKLDDPRDYESQFPDDFDLRFISKNKVSEELGERTNEEEGKAK